MKNQESYVSVLDKDCKLQFCHNSPLPHGVSVRRTLVTAHLTFYALYLSYECAVSIDI